MQPKALLHTSLVILVVLYFTTQTGAKRISGSIEDSHSEFRFWTKFCFDSYHGDNPSTHYGTLNYNFTYLNDAVIGKNYLILFVDTDDWYGAYHDTGLSCQQRIAKVGNRNQIVHIPHKENININESFSNVQRQHFWHMAFANCDGGGISIKYDGLLLQPNKNWNEQFSFEEIGLLEGYLFFLVVFVIFTAAHLHSMITMYRIAPVHPILWLLSSAVLLELVSIVFIFIHYMTYSGNGIGVPALKTLGEIFDICSQVVLIMLLIVLSKGWTITRAKIVGRNQIIVIFAIFVVVYFVIFIWGLVGVDPATTDYIYNSAPGIIILVVRSLAWIYFLYSIRDTLIVENHPTKRKFYKYFGVLYSLWFVALPIIVIMSVLISPWYSEKVVVNFYLVMNTLGLAVLSFLLWPTRSSDYFTITPPDLLAGTTPYDTI